jgi:predicted phage terminase large subunit-like protein
VTFAGAFAVIIDPPPPPPDLATPAGFAEAHSRGRWLRAAHLDIVEAAVLDAIARSGRLIVSVSVRHGKSELVSKWLTSWYLGTHPDARVVLAGHEADFASRWGRAARDILTEHGHRFGVAVSPRSEAANRWDLAPPHIGGMLTVGVGGSPIGRGADLMIVDDPVKSFEDAMSPLKRERVKEWWTGTMESRIEPGGAVILVMARWHQDDLAGFLLREAPEEWSEVRLPAIADDPDDPLGRAIGEPLWPERFDLPELERRRKATSLALGEAVWLAQYQQRPTSPGGSIFPEDAWSFASAIHESWKPIRWARGWDLAATKGGGDWTVGALLGRKADGTYMVADVVRGQWASSEVREQIRRTAAQDPPGTRVVLPQDPGQAGKDQAAQMVSMLAGYPVTIEPQTGSKVVRSAGWAAQQQAGAVTLLEGEWNGRFVAELSAFDRGTHDDQVDASASAFNALAESGRTASMTAYRNAALDGTR